MSGQTSINLDIPGWMSKEELAWLHWQAILSESVVEIGSWMGRSTYAILTGCCGFVTAVDHFKGSPDELETNHREAKTEDIKQVFMANVGTFPNLRVLPVDSITASESFEDLSIDMVFIDAQHTKEAVLADVRAWLPKAKRILVGHDIDIDGVRDALNELNIQWKSGPGSIWYVEIDDIITVKAKQKVLIGWPDGGSVNGRFMKSMLDLVKFETENPSDDYEIVIIDHTTGLYVQNNRNNLVRMAQHHKVDWLLQLDSDLEFNVDLLRTLMSTAHAGEKPIVVGVYSNVGNFNADGPGSFSIVDCLYGEAENGQYRIVSPRGLTPFQIDASGTGIMLTHLSVFSRIQSPWFWLFEFENADGSRQLMNEDIAFCRLAREVGIPIWCNPVAEAIHWKTIPLSSSSFREFLTRSKEVHKTIQGG